MAHHGTDTKIHHALRQRYVAVVAGVIAEKSLAGSQACGTMLRLKRSLPSSMARRVRTTLGISLPVLSSARMMKHRSACRKTLNRMSTILGKSESS